MMKCPFCDRSLQTRASAGWQCECGELIPSGFGVDSEENCETCPVLYCPRRKKPAIAELQRVQA